ncbi:hypothetical protein Anas_00631, partial [Armadillidium nasatum]
MKNLCTTDSVSQLARPVFLHTNMHTKYLNIHIYTHKDTHISSRIFLYPCIKILGLYTYEESLPKFPICKYTRGVKEKSFQSFPSEGQWKVGMWSKCKLESGSRLKQNDGLCLGSRYRNVTCQSSLSKKPDSCPDSIPPSKVSCYTICPQDCVVGPWTMWTPCGSCRDRKYRTRLVIIGPDHGGSSCPTLSESEPCFSKCLNETITISKDLTFLSYFETSTTVLEENVSSVDYSQTSSIPESTSTTVSSKPQEISKTHHYKLPKLRVGEWGECSVKKGTGKHRNKNSKKILNSQSNLIDQKTKNLNEDPFETHLEWEIRDALSLIGENTRNVDQIPEYLSPTQLEEIDRKNFEYPRVGIQERNLTCVGTGGEIRPLL